MAITNIDNLSLGQLLQIVFSEGVRQQLSQDYRDYEMVNSFKADISPAREYRFSFQSTLNPASIQYQDPSGAFRNFPTGFKPAVNEHTALMKTIEATIEIEYDLWDRARKSPEKYAEPLSLIIDSTMTSTKRRKAADLYGDGTGVIGSIAASSGVLSGSDVEFTLSSGNTDRGHVGLFEYGDILEANEEDGTASTLAVTGGTVAYWKVMEKDRDNDKVILRPLDSSFAEITATAVTQNTAAEVFYRFGQPTRPDLTSIGSADYATLTEVNVGLDSLAANDGRIVHGVEMSGATGSSTVDAGANALDVKYIQKVMDKVKINVGPGAYSWKQMISAPEAISALIESRETDRRFHSMEDNKRGTKGFGYQHGNDAIELISSEYCPKNRMYILPEGKASGRKVLDDASYDFEPVRANNGDEFHLKVNSSGYGNAMQSFLKGYCVLVANHPAAIARLTNFSL